MSTNELNTTARDLMSVRAMIVELEAEAEALTDKIKAAMVERGEEVLTGDGWKASWKNVTSSRLDNKALKAAMPEIAAQFTKTTTTTLSDQRSTKRPTRAISRSDRGNL